MFMRLIMIAPSYFYANVIRIVFAIKITGLDCSKNN